LAILLEDFQTAYEQVSRGEAIHLTKDNFFKQWAERLQSTAVSRIAAERDYWLAERRKPVARLPVDYSGREHGVRRTPYQSPIRKKPKLLQQVPKAYNTD